MFVLLRHLVRHGGQVVQIGPHIPDVSNLKQRRKLVVERTDKKTFIGAVITTAGKHYSMGSSKGVSLRDRVTGTLPAFW